MTLLCPSARPAHLRLLGSVCLLALSCAAPAAAQDFPADDDLEAMLRFVARDGGATAAVLGILEADGTKRVVTYGSGGPDAPPLGPRSVFEIASITKTFTATLLAEMVLRGEVALEDPVARYLPDHVTVPSRGGREITLLDLATHTSGLPPMPDNLGPRNPWWIFPDYTVDSLYDFLSGHELRGIPGTGYRYSNVNTGLLGHVLARAAGTTFRELLRERILDPLGMAMTDIGAADADSTWLVRGYRNGDPAPRFRVTEAFQGAGALRSNAEDMLRYIEANAGPPRTDLERAMRMAHEIRVPRGDGGGGYGLAWTIVIDADGQSIVMHGGVAGGFSARVALMPERGIGTILLTNQSAFTFQHGGGGRLLFPLPPGDEWQEAAVEPALLAGYAGSYAPARGRGRYEVRLAGGGYLTLEPRGGEPMRLHATSDSTFYLLGSPLLLTFRTGDDAGGDDWILEARQREGDPGAVEWTAMASQGALPSLGGTAIWGVFAVLGAVTMVAVLGIQRRRRRVNGPPPSG